jgi:hypothetical protein
LIFPSFRGVPVRLKNKKDQASVNLQFLRDYLGIRLLAVSMILKLAEIHNNDTPLLLTHLLGIEKRAAATYNEAKGDGNDNGNNSTDDYAALLLKILTRGRKEAYAWDAKESPLAALLFEELGSSRSKVASLLEQQADMAGSDDGDGARSQWFELLPPGIVESTRAALADKATFDTR